MPSQNKSVTITHHFGGGWATDFNGIVNAAPNQAGEVVIPYLTQAKNVEYDLSGAIVKAGGTAPYNSDTITVVSGENIISGMFEWWHRVNGSPRRKVVAHVEFPTIRLYQILSDTEGDATFNTIPTTVSSAISLSGTDVIPHYATFDDLLWIGTYGETFGPHALLWVTGGDNDGYYAQPVLPVSLNNSNPPQFSFSVQHKNRHWGAGDYRNPSSLYYSVSEDPLDWAGSGSGVIPIAPGDGDEITGIIPWNNELIVFKGPRYGSIWRISGSSDSGSDPFVLRPLSTSGITAAWQNSIFQFGNDIGFVSPQGTVHSLSTTERFGDMETGHLSLPINNWLRRNLNLNTRRKWWAVANDNTGQVFITVAQAGSTFNNLILVMDYRFMSLGEPSPRWSYFDFMEAQSLCITNEYGNLKRVMAGDREGRIWKLGYLTGNHNEVAITGTIETPNLTYGNLYNEKTLNFVAAGITPKNETTITVGWTRDAVKEQTATVTQGTTQGLGDFTLGTQQGTPLTPPPSLPRFCQAEYGGQFRTIRYRVTDDTYGSQLNLQQIITNISDSGLNMENTDGNQ